MTIRPGPGKELKITKEAIYLILGLPNAGGGKPFMDWYGEIDAAGRIRKDLRYRRTSLILPRSRIELSKEMMMN